MASRCWRTLGTAPIACIILSTVFIPSIFAKPFFSKEFKLSKADVQYYTTSPDYAYVKPIRLGTRHQRSIEETSVRSTSEYTVEGFDQVFHIQLSENMDLFNAGLLVRRINGEGDVRIEQPQSGCYHQGHLKDNEDTTSVSLSTCSDMVGMIRTPEADFALKPLKEEHILQMKSDDNEVPSHIMYKLSPSDMAAQQVNTENERRKDSKSERRETSGTKYLETSVVADSKMFDYHGDDTEFYLFTILNQVAGLFRDRSLSTDLRLLITSITIMEEPQSNLDLTDELSHSLKSFCKWQKGENSDISILLTRRDLEIGGNDAVTGKSKDIGGACDPSRRCIIAQDHGPSGTIFTLAHEIGHSLGMYHDDSESECTDNKNIMASENSGGSEAFKWSRCSNNDLLEFLSSDDSQCLDEVVDDFPAYNSETVLMPGHFYDALKQCQMTFGPEATVSDGYLYSKDMCAELQCVLPSQSEPVTNHIPALDGTKCSTARGAICVHGQCLKVVSMYDCEGGQCVPEWLPGSFGECQDDCFAYRNVFCVERRDDGTTVLVSDFSLCPVEKPDEREYCCQTQPVVGETGYQILSTQCSVTCGTGVETREVACVDSEGTVVNDTFCTDERPSEMGGCAIPCPGVTYVLFYGAYGDCSVTCGDGVESRDAFCSTSQGASESIEICRSVFPSVVTERDCNLGTCPGTVVDTFFYVTTPVGDCSVTCGDGGIQQLAVTCQNLDGITVDDANCANLQRPASSVLCMLEPCSEVYRYVATTFSACSVTCGTGLQTRTVYCLNEANRVVDEMFCSNLERPSESQSCTLQACSITYFYEAEPFPECTLMCGNQVFTRTVSCRSSEGDLVSSVNCVNTGLAAPPTTFDCELEPCGNYVYSVGEYGECSATCGVGIQQRSVTCIDLDNDNATVANNLCSENAPTSAILCDLGECPTEYSYLTSPYSDCSCAGTQTRIVVCITFMNGAPVPATDMDCQSAGIERPNDSQSCQVPISCNPVWRFGEWSDCSVSCGNGVRSRVVFCVESEQSNVIVPSTSCNATEEPASVDICNEGDCITYTWVSENFGECSVTCGEGVRMRNVLCYAISGGTFEVVDASRCDPSLEPPSEEICDLEECGGVFEATPWSECSVTCAQGVQTRSVSCVLTKGSGTVIPEMECGNMTRPSETRECYLEACPEPYGCDQSYPTEGSITYTLESPGYPMGYPADLECSKDLVAPEGSIIRITFTDLQLEDGCAYDSVRLIDAETSEVTSLCDEVDLPYVYESSGSTLEVLFTTDASVSRRGFTASYQAIPATIIEYRTGEWSECSVTCGMGVERRELTCVEDGEEVDDSECVGLPMPSVEQPCMLDECPLPGACGENILRRGPGAITSPNYPSVYPNNVTCGNTIRAPPGLVVNITVDFLLFINQGLPCGSGDYIEVKDSSSDSSLIVCQSTDLVNKISLTNEVSVTFFSDGRPAPSGTGFSLSFSFVEPEVDICGSNVTTSGQPIYSPNYPDNYDDNTTCVTEIINDDGCISIQFLVMDIDNGDFIDGICREDSLTISDQNNPSLSQTYCSEISRESHWLSASGNVEVSFTSNSVNTSSGYIAIATFVECPQAFWIPLPFGNCSAICGVGNRTRELECRNALTNELTFPSECPEEEPPRTEPCFLEECPSCDVTITEGNQVFEFPFNNDYYLYNDECTLTITNNDGCISLFFTSLDIDQSVGDECGDYLSIYDAQNVYANEPYCRFMGTPSNAISTVTYQSLGSTVELTLRTPDSERFKSVGVFPSFGACAPFAFVPGPWSECSASCEGGTRTREVLCLNVLTSDEAESTEQCNGGPEYDEVEECNTDECPDCLQQVMTPGVITSPGFSTDNEGYENNLDCMFNITNPYSDECITISFINFDLGDPSDNCSDYIQISDRAGDVDAVYCGLEENVTAPVFYSRSAYVEVVFITNEEDRNAGFEALVGFTSCPEFGFFAGNFSECSVTCGEGFEYRTVECRRFSDGIVVVDEICRDQKPADSRPCSRPECPSCDRVLTEEGIFTSPNSPDNYDDNQECEYTLIAPQDECVRVSFIGTFDLGENTEDCENGDYVTLSDENWEYIEATYCREGLPPIWRSRTNESSLTFYSNERDNFKGFTAFLAFVTCPQYGFTVGEYGECDVTCGSGIQTRDVQCSDLTTGERVNMGLCTDPMPATAKECNDEPCPTCSETFTTNGVTITREDFMEDEYCVYNITSLEGLCVRLYLITWNLSPPPNREFRCVGDSLTFTDAAYPYRSGTVCGESEQLQETVTYGSTGLIYFEADDVDNGGNFQIFAQFEECSEYGYAVTNYSECSETCGLGYRSRDVFCTLLETGEMVGEGNCTEDAPPALQACILEPCFDCNLRSNESATIVSPGYPENYSSDLVCNYFFDNPDEGQCWEIVPNDFNLYDGSNSTCSDGFYVTDVGFPERESYPACGSDLPRIVTFSSKLQITFYTNDEGESRGFNVSINSVPCPQYGYLAGPYEECSVTCGEGLSFRNVTCQDLDTREAVNESLCEDIKPDDARPCYRGPCPTCDAFIYEDAQYINSPNFPDTYEGDLNCTTIITAPQGMCINLFIISLELPEPDMYAGCFGSDYLLFIDAISSEAPYFDLDQVYCGSEEAVLWYSAQNIAILTFFSTEGGFPGYQIYSSFVNCQQYFYAVMPFGECSVTCGLGELRREIFCVDRNANYSIVNDSFCASDTRPVETVPCYPDDCPIGCDLFVTDNNQTVATDDSVEQICEVGYLNPEDGCIRFDIVLDLPEPNEEGECEDGSYVTYIEDAEYGREIISCGNTSFSLTSRSNNSLLTLFSSGEGSSSVSVINTFVECPLYGFIAGEEYDECSASCDGGFQMRTVSCTELASGTVVNDSFCEDERPEDTRPCNENPCPTCDRYINATDIIRQRSSESNDECVYTVDVADSCIAVSFLSFSLQDEMDGECSENMHIRDLAPYTDELDETFCGDGPPLGYQWLSRSGQVQIRYDSAGQQGADYNLFVRVLPCPQYGFIYGNYSECSVTCGEGVQTRDVSCVELDNGVPGNVTSDSQCNDPRPDSTVECELDQCPSCDRNYTLSSSTSSIIVNSDRPYSRLSMCTNTITADDGMCIRVNFASLDIEDSEDCVNDSLLVVDPNNTAINFSVCGSGTVQPIFSTSNMLTLTLSTNGAIEGMGYAAIANRIDCPDVVWSTTNVGSCSVTCGVGVQSRNVFCMNNLNGRRFLQEESCTGERPADEVPCDMGDCPQACNQVFIGEEETELTSPGYPGPYENDTVCPNTYVSLMTCLAVVVADIDLGPAENCQNDYIEIFDSTIDMSVTRIRLCGNELPENNLWVGRTTPFFIRFTSDESGNYGGYNLSLSYVPCPMQGFTVGEFGECSATCRSGERTRNVTCEDSMGRILPDSSCWGQRPLSSEPCGTNCTYNVREEWSPCSVTCGSGVQERNVSCVDNFGNPVNISLCNIDVMNVTRRQCNLTECPAPVDGNFTQWTTWSSCSASCGIGSQIRRRTCTNPPPSNGGRFCIGQSFVARACNPQPCPPPVDGNFTRWSAWSSCSESCGNGTQTRNRTCTDPPPSNGGADCTGPSTETQVCNTQACPAPVDGNFTQWSTWTVCTVTCGTGVQLRTRTCTNPPPSNGGASCTGPLFENRPCNTQSCPPPVDGNFTQWSTWSSCSESCGNGTQTRNRTCTDPPPSNGGADCTDPSTETQVCNTQACPAPDCNNTIDGATTVSGNLTSPNYPDASPADQMCVVNFIIPSGLILNIRFTEFNLDSNCLAESVMLSAPVAGDTTFCSNTIMLPASVTYTADSTLTLLYLTDSDISNSPYYFAEFMFISISP
ncbi:uncharacterized protein LOC129278063 isoform X2 [Lytechinus pictus]|uniref:uncharacterized protein LOC129278063 isoform X2 n=1 Tax=Lytechinus pictus TaxID=7653 RepID=UPI0030B9D9B7